MPRLQFHIRTLLLVMVVVGGGITVFRWPWTVTTHNEHETVVTPYRRSWSGTAVKHGIELSTDKNSGTVRKWYVEGELRRERHESTAGFVLDESFRDGKLDGPYFERSTAVTAECFYRQGKPEGTWKQLYSDLLRTSEWHDGELHGPSTWRTPGGELLQSAEYERGKLVGWNNLPAPAAIEQWMDDNQIDDELRRNLLDTFTTDPRSRDGMALGRLVKTLGGERRQHVYWIGPKPTRALVISPYEMEWLRDFPVDRPAGEVLLAQALDSSTMFVYRYQRLGIVRISAAERDWRDRTGVYKIRFEPGSQQEEFWLAPGRLERNYFLQPGFRFQRLLYEGTDIPIPFDTTAIDDLQSLSPGGHGIDSPGYPRPRRDVLGDFLNDRGYYCELVNGTLVFKPHPETLLRLKE